MAPGRLAGFEGQLGHLYRLVLEKLRPCSGWEDAASESPAAGGAAAKGADLRSTTRNFARPGPILRTAWGPPECQCARPVVHVLSIGASAPSVHSIV